MQPQQPASEVSFSRDPFSFSFVNLLQYVPMAVDVVYHDENMDIDYDNEPMDVDVVEDDVMDIDDVEMDVDADNNVSYLFHQLTCTKIR